MTIARPAGRSIRHAPKSRLLEVAQVTRLTSRMVRVTLTGSDIEGFASDGADDHMKVRFPHPGETRPVMPVPGPDGPVYPEGVAKPVSRDFTPRRFDPVAGTLDVDFVLHGDGPASSWASQAATGQALGIGGPRGSFVINYDFDWYLLIGDESALPAIGRRLEELPAGSRATVIAEIADKSEEQAFDTQATVDFRWLRRDGAEAGTTTLQLDCLQSITFPEGTYFAWAAGEANTLRAIRRHLLAERETPKEHLRVSGYWKRGIAGHDHHAPIED